MSMDNSIPKNKFKETRYPISKKIPYYIFEEGIGGSGYYTVEGAIDVRKRGERYEAAITAKACTDAGKFGKAIFSCTAILYVNGAKKDEKKLQGGDKEAKGAKWCNLGGATFVLPVGDADVGIGLEVGYFLHTNASMHGASNKPAQWVYNNIWKNLGEFMGEIRQEILTL